MNEGEQHGCFQLKQKDFTKKMLTVARGRAEEINKKKEQGRLGGRGL